MEPKTEKKKSKVDMGAALPKEKVAGPSGRGFQGSGQDFKLQATQSLKFQSLKFIEHSRLGGGRRPPPSLDLGPPKAAPLYISRSELEIPSSGQLAA